MLETIILCSSRMLGHSFFKRCSGKAYLYSDKKMRLFATSEENKFLLIFNILTEKVRHSLFHWILWIAFSISFDSWITFAIRAQECIILLVYFQCIQNIPERLCCSYLLLVLKGGSKNSFSTNTNFYNSYFSCYSINMSLLLNILKSWVRSTAPLWSPHGSKVD